MRAELQPPTRFGSVRTGSDLERKYPVALALYLALGLLVWFTVGEGAVQVFGRPVEIRLVALLVIGSFALRTVVARKADKILRGSDNNGGMPRDV